MNTVQHTDDMSPDGFLNISDNGNSSKTNPVGKFPDRLSYVLNDKKLGSVVINNYGGGMFKDFVAEFFGIDKSNTYFAITNNNGNDVWIHKNNCSVLSWGDTLQSLSK